MKSEKLQLKIKNFLFRFWPVIFVFTIWVIFSSPYFFQSKVPYPAKYQATFFPPWSYYQEFAGPVKNDAMPDVINQIYPWKKFTIDTLKSGQLPLWNPYNFAGTPHLANFQSAVFSPFNLLFFILPFIDAWSMLVLLQVLFAGFFTYKFMRELNVSSMGSLIGSISFMFCGFIVVWLAYGTLSMAIALLPLVLFAIEKSFHKKSFWTPPLISIAIASSFFSGHVQTSLYLASYSALYIFFKLITTKNWKKFLTVTVFFAFGIGIACLQVLPTLSLYEQSVRSNLVYQGGQIPLNYLVTIFAPDFFGNPVTRNQWFGYYAEWASFIGIIPLVLAFFAFTKLKNKYIYFFAVVGILALMFSSDTLFRQILSTSGIPVLATSIPSRMIVLFSFSFVILAGFGFDNLQNLIKKNSKKQIIIIFSLLGLLLLFLWASLLSLGILPPDKISLAKRNLLLPTMLFVVMMSTVVFALFVKYKKTYIVVGILILLLTCFDSLRFATKWVPFDQRDLVFPDTKVVQEMKKLSGTGRVYGNLGAQVESYYGIQSLKGYDPLYIGRYGEFIRSSFSGKYENGERSVVQLASRGKYTERVIDFLGVNIIYHPKADTFAEWAFPVWADKGKYTLVFEDDKFQLYKNNSAHPRAMLFYKFEVIKNDRELIEKFYSEKFDFKNVLLLNEDPNLVINDADTKGSAEITLYTPNKISISVETTKPALLFLSDSYYQNWKVKVNGKTDKIYVADHAFRAVKVPAGKSTVEFYYQGLF